MKQLIKTAPKDKVINYRQFYLSKSDSDIIKSFDNTFTYYIPRFLEMGVDLKLDEKTLYIMDQSDYICYFYRRRLSGADKTSRKLYFGIRELLKDHPSNKSALLIFSFIVQLYHELMKNELYEIIVKQNELTAQIFKFIKKEFRQIDTKLFESTNPADLEILCATINKNNPV